MVVNAKFLLTAFMFVEQKEAAPATPAKGGRPAAAKPGGKP
jgi:hypothetical protein